MLKVVIILAAAMNHGYAMPCKAAWNADEGIPSILVINSLMRLADCVHTLRRKNITCRFQKLRGARAQKLLHQRKKAAR